MFDRTLSDVTFAQVEELIASGVQEGQTVELKEQIASSGGAVDGWYSGADSIGNYGRNKLLREIVAFANSVGGYLLIGIVESEDSPPRATAVKPVQRCHALAERLRLQCRDCIEPQLPWVECVGIEKANGEGVVIVRVPSSPLAPHRLEPRKECFVRRADRSEAMTMTEIQQLVVNRGDSSRRLDERFKDLRKSVPKRDTRPGVPGIGSKPWFQLRAFATPTMGNLAVPTDELQPCWRRAFEARYSGIDLLLDSPAFFDLTRPGLQCEIWTQANESTRKATAEISRDGSIAAACLLSQVTYKEEPSQPVIHPEPIAAFVANMLVTIDRVRSSVLATDREYGLEIELSSYPKGAKLMKYGPASRHSSDDIGPFYLREIQLPRYSIRERASYDRVVSDAMDQVLRCAGSRNSEELAIDWKLV